MQACEAETPCRGCSEDEPLAEYRLHPAIKCRQERRGIPGALYAAPTPAHQHRAPKVH